MEFVVADFSSHCRCQPSSFRCIHGMKAVMDGIVTTKIHVRSCDGVTHGYFFLPPRCLAPLHNFFMQSIDEDQEMGLSRLSIEGCRHHFRVGLTFRNWFVIFFHSLKLCSSQYECCLKKKQTFPRTMALLGCPDIQSFYSRPKLKPRWVMAL